MNILEGTVDFLHASKAERSIIHVETRLKINMLRQGERV